MSRVGRDYAYQQARLEVLDGATICHICLQPLDFDAPARSRWAPSADHILPVSRLYGLDDRTARQIASDPAGLRPVHYGCNSRRGAGRRSEPRHVSREWA